MTYNDSYRLEGSPAPAQCARLENFLTELTLISRRYGLLVDGYVDERQVQILDVESGTIIGLDLLYTVERSGKIVTYDCEFSILDGVWLVDTPDGPVEQLEILGRAARTSRNGALRR